MLDFLGLEGLERETLGLLLEIDRCREYKARQALRRVLSRLQKLLAASRYPVVESSLPTVFECTVLAALDLLGGAPTVAALHRRFGRAQNRHVDLALQALVEKGYAQAVGRTIKATGKVIFLADADGKDSHLQFVEQATKEASGQVKRWFDAPDLSCFQTFLLSVRQAEYQEAVKRIKTFTYEQMAGLETSAGDSIVQFNLQIFPRLQPR